MKESYSHNDTLPPFEEFYPVKRQQIIHRGELPHVTVARQLEILDLFSESEIGRFYLRNKGSNGYWTEQIMLYPKRKGQYGKLTDSERFLFEQAPIMVATQERHLTFCQEIQNELKNGMTIASIPCGTMYELSELDFSKLPDCRLIGVDLDPQSLALAHDNLERARLHDQATLYQSDAWNLDLIEPVDILSSNGLNFYVESGERRIALYQQFFKLLKPGGMLITSFYSPSPLPGKTTEWKMEYVNDDHLATQRILFSDIMQAKFPDVRLTSQEVAQELHQGGFRDIKIIFDRAHIMPTFIARKLA